MKSSIRAQLYFALTIKSRNKNGKIVTKGPIPFVQMSRRASVRQKEIKLLIKLLNVPEFCSLFPMIFILFFLNKTKKIFHSVEKQIALKNKLPFLVFLSRNLICPLQNAPQKIIVIVMRRWCVPTLTRWVAGCEVFALFLLALRTDASSVCGGAGQPVCLLHHDQFDRCICFLFFY